MRRSLSKLFHCCTVQPLPANCIRKSHTRSRRSRFRSENCEETWRRLHISHLCLTEHSYSCTCDRHGGLGHIRSKRTVSLSSRVRTSTVVPIPLIFANLETAWLTHSRSRKVYGQREALLLVWWWRWRCVEWDTTGSTYEIDPDSIFAFGTRANRPRVGLDCN